MLLRFIPGLLLVDRFLIVDGGVFPRFSAFGDVAGETSDGHGDGSCKAAGRGLQGRGGHGGGPPSDGGKL